MLMGLIYNLAKRENRMTPEREENCWVPALTG